MRRALSGYNCQQAHKGKYNEPRKIKIKILKNFADTKKSINFVTAIKNDQWKDAGVVDRGGLENRCAFYVPGVRIPLFPQPNRTKISPKATNRRLSNSSAVFSCLILSIQDRIQTKKSFA